MSQKSASHAALMRGFSALPITAFKHNVQSQQGWLPVLDRRNKS